MTTECSSELPLVKSFIQLDVFSAGYYVGNRFSIKKDWNDIFSGRKRGINLLILDEVTGSVVATEDFDTHASSTFSNQLALTIEQIRPGRIVCAAVSGDGQRNLNLDAKRALGSLGSEKIDQLIYQGSWALIGIKGAPRGYVIEKVLNISSVHLSAQVHLKPFHQTGIEITAESAGLNAGSYVTIKVNGVVVDIPHTGYNRGMNVVIVNEENGAIMDSQIFDTSAESSAYSPSDEFRNLITCQHEGRIVIVAIKDEGVAHLSETAKKACESIGSAMIRQVSHGGSWAIIGRKGAKIGSVPESASNSQSSNVTFFLSPSNDSSCLITLHSSASGIGVSVNGTDIAATGSNMILALLENGKCSVERSQTFAYSQSNDMLDFVKLIPPERTVLANLGTTFLRYLNYYSKAVLEAIGSVNLGYPKPWAIIGKKGAPRGSVLEQSDSGEQRALGTSFTLETVNAAFISVQTAGVSFGNYAKIEINGKPVSFSSEYDRSLLVVVLNESNTNILHSQAFDHTNASLQHTELFVNLTYSLPLGSVVVIATNDAASLRLSSAAKEAIEGLGSKYISRTTNGGSWALIGRKGAPQGSVLEAASNNGPAEIITQALPMSPVHDNTICRIFVESAGTGSLGGLQLTINGHSTTLPSSNGVRVTVIKEESCEVESVNTYTTQSSSSLAQRITAIPRGRIVIASAYGSAFNYYRYRYGRYYFNAWGESAKKALESIGSTLFRTVGYRDAWAIIGKKGATPGSVPESLSRSLNDRRFRRSSAVAVGDVFKLRQPSCRDELYPLDCLLLGELNITIT